MIHKRALLAFVHVTVTPRRVYVRPEREIIVKYDTRSSSPRVCMRVCVFIVDYYKYWGWFFDWKSSRNLTATAGCTDIFIFFQSITRTAHVLVHVDHVRVATLDVHPGINHYDEVIKGSDGTPVRTCNEHWRYVTYIVNLLNRCN